MNSKEDQVFNLLLIEYLFSKEITKQKAKKKKSLWDKRGLKNRMYASAFNDIFAELMINDKEEFR